jgi:hypothetical protein
MIEIYLKDTLLAQFVQDDKSYLIDVFELSLQNKTIKELPFELINTW